MMGFYKHFKLVWKDFLEELKNFEYGQYFFAYILVATFLFISNESKGLSVVGLFQQIYFLLIMFIVIVAMILIFTIPSDRNSSSTKKSKHLELKKVSFGFIKKFGAIVFTGYGVVFWYLLFIIYDKQMWDKILYIFGILFFMLSIKFFISAIMVNQSWTKE